MQLVLPAYVGSWRTHIEDFLGLTIHTDRLLSHPDEIY